MKKLIATILLIGISFSIGYYTAEKNYTESGITLPENEIATDYQEYSIEQDIYVDKPEEKVEETVKEDNYEDLPEPVDIYADFWVHENSDNSFFMKQIFLMAQNLCLNLKEEDIWHRIKL